MSQPHREPSADLRAAAAGLRALYNALVSEGFAPSEALTIIGHVLASRDAGA